MQSFTNQLLASIPIIYNRIDNQSNKYKRKIIKPLLTSSKYNSVKLNVFER